ncbi:MAG: hydantoinase/oxoprolinase family protein, partial [Deltaproteobacteria bacterium]|nr:hydantoinase/oxoprolinase family protein [Deltaproteobacteria bacterium]
MKPQRNKWQFWIDRGGTFTDVIGRAPNGDTYSAKHLSENPEHYSDAAIFGIRQMLGVDETVPLSDMNIEAIKMGTTVGTNALLEHKGERVALFVTRGFNDLLQLGYQHRSNIFSLKPNRPTPLYDSVHEIHERLDAKGRILIPLDVAHARSTLSRIFESGIRSIAIVLLHGYRFPNHENQLAEIATAVGFTHISVSHRISPSIKIVSRGDTTVVDAYLSPLLKRYISSVSGQLSRKPSLPAVANSVGSRTDLMFMQSHGGMVDAAHFQGKDSILSGPAGGIVGAVRTCVTAGYTKLITFDMGGTSTDVAHYNGEIELNFETEIAGVRLQCPMINIHTVAAGGGSILKFENNRCQVGPASAGAHPGPASYRKGGPLTVTDCNLVLGKILPLHFPRVFGPHANQSLDKDIATERFKELTHSINAAFITNKCLAEIAEGFLNIAVENMARAIKRISVQRGYNVKEYTLCCFGGAGAQHACKTADALGMRTIFIHPYAGVLSALGMGLADNVIVREKSVLIPLDADATLALKKIFRELHADAAANLSPHFDSPVVLKRLMLRYEGSDSLIAVPLDIPETMRRQFEAQHIKQFGFVFNEKPIQIATAVCEVRQPGADRDTRCSEAVSVHTPLALENTHFFSNNQWHQAGVYVRETLLA